MGRALLGSQHVSPNEKTLCDFKLQTWPAKITSRDAQHACLEG